MSSLISRLALTALGVLTFSVISIFFTSVGDLVTPTSGPCIVADFDQDGVPSLACGGADCNDENPAVNPDQEELCDGLDNDCDGQVDENLTGRACAVPPSEQRMPSQPTNLIISADSTERVTVSWTDKSVNETGFLIERKTSSGQFIQIGVTGANTVSFNDRRVSPGGTYAYRVRAFGSGIGYSPYSNTAIAIVPQLPGCSDGLDNDSDGKIDYPADPDCGAETDRSERDAPNPDEDRDGDGYSPPEDCNDNDPNINPDAPEICGDGIDQNCDGSDEANCDSYLLSYCYDKVSTGYRCDDDEQLVCDKLADCVQSKPQKTCRDDGLYGANTALCTINTWYLCTTSADLCNKGRDVRGDFSGFICAKNDSGQYRWSSQNQIDEDPTVGSGDEDCDGRTNECDDKDKDGYTTCEGDYFGRESCSDHDPGIFPGIGECSGICGNNRCDADESYQSCPQDCPAPTPSTSPTPPPPSPSPSLSPTPTPSLSPTPTQRPSPTPTPSPTPSTTVSPYPTPSPGLCGDGSVNPGEECDDGNTENGDGCSAECKIEDIVGLWKFENDVRDGSGFGNHGIIFGNPTFVSGKDGLAIDLDGLDDYVQVGTNGMSADSGTVAIWVRPDGFAGNKHQYIWGHTTIPPYANRGQLYVDENNPNGTPGWLDIGLGDSHRVSTNVVKLEKNVWQHVALTWDRGVYRVYLNGVLIEDGSYSGLRALNDYIHFGNTGYETWLAQYWDGALDEARHYSRALSGEEIASLAGFEFGIPSAPRNLIATLLNRRTVTLNWEDTSDNEDKFVIERATGDNDFTFLKEVPKDSIAAHDSPGPNQTYRYRLYAENTIGRSTYSNEATITMPPLTQCSDEIDNDGDRKIDMADPGCTGEADDDESDEPPPTPSPSPTPSQSPSPTPSPSSSPTPTPTLSPTPSPSPTPTPGGFRFLDSVPENGTSNVEPSGGIELHFSGLADPATVILDTTVTLTEESYTGSATIDLRNEFTASVTNGSSESVVTIVPSDRDLNRLRRESDYTLTLTAGIRSRNGDPLENPGSIQFATEKTRRPNVSINEAEMNLLRSRIGTDPWKTSFWGWSGGSDNVGTKGINYYVNDGSPAPITGAMNREPNPYTGTDPNELYKYCYGDSSAGRYSDAHALEALGLAYQLTGNEAYAERAEYYLVQWAQAFNPPDCWYSWGSIKPDICLVGFSDGAEMTWDSNQWSDENRRLVASWLKDYANATQCSNSNINSYQNDSTKKAQQCSYTLREGTSNNPTHKSPVSNFYTWELAALAKTGYFLDDVRGVLRHLKTPPWPDVAESRIEFPITYSIDPFIVGPHGSDGRDAAMNKGSIIDDTRTCEKYKRSGEFTGYNLYVLKSLGQALRPFLHNNFNYFTWISPKGTSIIETVNHYANIMNCGEESWCPVRYLEYPSGNWSPWSAYTQVTGAGAFEFFSMLRTDPIVDVLTRTDYESYYSYPTRRPFAATHHYTVGSTLGESGMNVYEPTSGTPAAPTNLSAVSARTDVIIRWNAPSFSQQNEEDKIVYFYDIYRNGSMVGTVSYPRFTDIGLQPGTTYSYEIKSRNFWDVRSSGVTVSATTLSLP